MAITMYAPAAPSLSRTLFVDLDGTLLATDLLWESLLILIKTNPCKLVFLPLWLVKGKAHFKQQLARPVVLNPAPYPITRSREIQQAQRGLVSRCKGIYPGPNTDLWGFAYRYDGCHFSDEGLEYAASLWLHSLNPSPLRASAE